MGTQRPMSHTEFQRTRGETPQGMEHDTYPSGVGLTQDHTERDCQEKLDKHSVSWVLRPAAAAIPGASLATACWGGCLLPHPMPQPHSKKAARREKKMVDR